MSQIVVKINYVESFSFDCNAVLTLWRVLLPYGYSHKASCARRGQAVICNFWHPGTLAEHQSARMPKITNDGLTPSGTGCFIAVPIWQQCASKGYRSYLSVAVVCCCSVVAADYSKVDFPSFSSPGGHRLHCRTSSSILVAFVAAHWRRIN